MNKEHLIKLKNEYNNYIINNNIDKSFLDEKYFGLFLKIIDLFSKNPWTLQEDIFKTYFL